GDVRHRVLLLRFAGDGLVRRGDRDAGRYAGQFAEVAGIDGPLVAGDADGGAAGARDGVRGESELAYAAFDDRLRLSRHIGMQDDEHRANLPQVPRRWPGFRRAPCRHAGAGMRFFPSGCTYSSSHAVPSPHAIVVPWSSSPGAPEPATGFADWIFSTAPSTVVQAPGQGVNPRRRASSSAAVRLQSTRPSSRESSGASVAFACIFGMRGRLP